MTLTEKLIKIPYFQRKSSDTTNYFELFSQIIEHTPIEPTTSESDELSVKTWPIKESERIKLLNSTLDVLLTGYEKGTDKEAIYSFIKQISD